jgi:hypothetical protein
VKPLQPARPVHDERQQQQWLRYMTQEMGVPQVRARQEIAKLLSLPVWMNDTYQVTVEPDGDFVHLSIKRLDKRPIHDWRDLQEIKNQLVGPECEGVELYPAQSRVVDTANQFHLWVLREPGVRIPIGFEPGRPLRSETSVGGSVQRPFEQGK